MMRILTFASISILLLSACTTVNTPAVTQELAGNTQPLQPPLLSTSTPTSTTGISQVVSLTPTPTLSASPILENPDQEVHWYWVLEDGTNSLFAVNESGEKHELGSLMISDSAGYLGFSISDERVVLFTLEGVKLEAFLLDLDGMNPIQLPPGLPWDSFTSMASLSIAAIFNDQVVFTYATRQSVGGDVNSYPDNGPIILMNLTTKTSSLLDTAANRDVYNPGFNDPRIWFHQSNDQRYLRYIDGSADQDKRLREVDLLTGEVRTVHVSRGSPYNMLASPEGDLWYFPDKKTILEINGAQIPFDDTTGYFFPLGNGKGLVLERGCLLDCEIRLFSPFEGGLSVTYQLPWSSSGSFYPIMSQVTSNQDLLFLGRPMRYFDDPSPLASRYPELGLDDIPVFRLTPDGQSRLVGAYINDTGYGSFPLSVEGRFYLLESTELEDYFLYDVLEDRGISEIPLDPELDYFYTNVDFFPSGIVINQVATTTDKYYRTFYTVYSHGSRETQTWEIPQNEFYECSDYLPVNELICFHYDLVSNYQNLVRYNIETEEFTLLMKQVVSIVFNE